MDKLREWKKQIKNYDHMTFNEIQEYGIQYSIETDENKKAFLLNKVVNDSIYLIIEFIENNSFDVLDNGSYDVEDIMSLATEYFIELFKANKIKDYKSFNSIFGKEFYAFISNGLVSNDIDEEKSMKQADFAALYNLFLELIKENDELTYEEFTQEVIDRKDIDPELENVISYLDLNQEYLTFKYDLEYVFNLFKTIQKNTNNKIDESTFTRSRLMLMKSLLMNKAYNTKLTKDIPANDDIESLLNEESIKSLLDFLRTKVDEKEYEVFVKAFGLDGSITQGIEEIAEEVGLTKERVRIILARNSQILARNQEKHGFGQK